MKRKHPTWGSKKLRTELERQDPEVKWPARSTIDALLKRNGLVEPRKRRRQAKPSPTPLGEATDVNEIWCADYKGQFRLGNGQYCCPLTITDQHSRFIIGCEGFSRISTEEAQESFMHAFRRYGVPRAIRTDNGPPFASQGLRGWSRLSVWWLRLGIELQRIQPGKPQQNGRHERMHRTLKAETTRPAAYGLLSQQERFDDFVTVFNTQRPHEALGQRRPSDLYRKASRSLPASLPEPKYPFHDDVRKVTTGGHVVLSRRCRAFVSAALVGQLVGLREEDDGRWLISFMETDLGHLDHEGRFVEV